MADWQEAKNKVCSGCRAAGRLALGLYCAVLALAAQAAAQEEIRIGVLTDLSARMPIWGQQTVRGVQAAQADLRGEQKNARIIVEDHAMSTKQAVSAAKKLFDIDRVEALYVEFSLPSQAIAPLVKERGKLAVFNSPIESVIADNPYAFRSFTDFRQMCSIIARYWKEHGIQSVAVLRIASESGDLCAQGAKQHFADFDTILFNTGDDLKPYLLRLSAQGTRAVFNIGLEPDILNSLKALRDLPLKMRIGAVENMFNQEAVDKYPQSIEHVDMVGFARISEGFKARFKDAPELSIEAAALAYTHIGQLARAIAGCGSNDAACQAEKMQSSPPDETAGFLGWDERRARYQYAHRQWRDRRKTVISESRQ